jgi:hypothetical protein
VIGAIERAERNTSFGNLEWTAMETWHCRDRLLAAAQFFLKLSWRFQFIP